MSDSFVTLLTVAHQTYLPMRFSHQEYWNGLTFPSPGDLPDPGIKPASPAWQADSSSLRHLKANANDSLIIMWGGCTIISLCAHVHTWKDELLVITLA